MSNASKASEYGDQAGQCEAAVYKKATQITDVRILDHSFASRSNVVMLQLSELNII